MQIKTRVAGVLAISAAAIAIMGGPAFASNNLVVGNIVGNGNIPILSGNNVQIPVQVRSTSAATPWASWASPTPAARAAPRPSWPASTAKLTSVVKAAGSRGTRRPLP